MISHTAFFGDGPHTFTLSDDMVTELERVTGTGIGALYLRTVSNAFNMADLVQIIRLGLIGAGTAPQDAMRLVDTYARNRPLAETFPLALDILDARWSGKPEAAA
jgi:hypothetical protein